LKKSVICYTWNCFGNWITLAWGYISVKGNEIMQANFDEVYFIIAKSGQTLVLALLVLKLKKYGFNYFKRFDITK
jgi:hypothetical protein